MILLPVPGYADSVSVAVYKVIATTERGNRQADTGGHIIQSKSFKTINIIFGTKLSQ
jgi:hypothetical protein